MVVEEQVAEDENEYTYDEEDYYDEEEGEAEQESIVAQPKNPRSSLKQAQQTNARPANK